MKILRYSIVEERLLIEYFSLLKFKWKFFYKCPFHEEIVEDKRLSELIQRIYNGEYIIWKKK